MLPPQHERLAKFLANAGIAARRKSEELILRGLIQVNGKTITTPVYLVTPGVDQVFCNGVEVKPPEQHHTYMLNKPAGYTCTVEDKHAEKTIYQLLPPNLQNLRYVGRLDRETEGLLLLSNDGELVQRLTHPSHQVPKVYQALCKGKYTNESAKQMLRGIYDDGDLLRARTVHQEPGKEENTHLLTITLTEGKKREVRRLCRRVGLPVLRLTRIEQGGVSLGSLPQGKFRELTPEENQLLLSSIQPAARPKSPRPASPHSAPAHFTPSHTPHSPHQSSAYPRKKNLQGKRFHS